VPSVNHSATINSDNQKNSSGDNKTLASVSQQRQSCVPSVVTDSIQIDAHTHPDRRATLLTAAARVGAGSAGRDDGMAVLIEQQDGS
jgi:hypothetical protein